jgi:NAD(P)H-hydrate epimerase
MARATAAVIGPGLGAAPETASAVEAIVRNTNIPVLLDADALRPEAVRAALGRRLVATPHAGEWQRIAGVWPAEAVLVAKGSPTCVRAGNASHYSFFGGPVLARGGSGDLLAGMIGGLMVQAPDDLLLAAARGVVWHGLAADLLARDKGQVAVQTTQLLDYLRPALHCTDHETT